MIRYLTLLALKIFNRALKSELTNIVPLYSPGVNDKFPGGFEALCGWLRLPEPQVKRSVKIS